MATIDLGLVKGDAGPQGPAGATGPRGEQGPAGTIPSVKTEGTGAAYTAAVPEITSLEAGTLLTIIPHTASTQTSPTLNLNGTGGKTIQRLNSGNTEASYPGAAASWLAAEKPVLLQYNGSSWIVTGLAKPNGDDMAGVVPVANGGTGSTSVNGARSNLKCAGLSFAGAEVQPTYDSSYIIASEGAEIYNDYRGRTYTGEVVISGNVASGRYSHAEGSLTTASANHAHAEGYNSIASGSASHAEGDFTVASGNGSHAEGYEADASGEYSHAEGGFTTASGYASHAEGYYTTAPGFAFHACGKYNVGSYGCQTPFDATGTLFEIGKGASETARANALRVAASGETFGNGAFNTSGADYAEMFEWLDGNPDGEDRRGLFVTLDGEKIRVAGSDDAYILGVVSANPAILGDSYFGDNWHGMYLRDVFGALITETVQVEETVDEITGETIPAHDGERHVLNPDWDHEQSYIARGDRAEWAPVGMLGKLVVTDDGSCAVNGYCKAGANGTATAAEAGYRVLARIDQTHIRVLIR